NLYGDMREEARDHARIRNACFEQATQAYLAGNKAAAKELSARGQWHNEQMKAAHAKASDAIFRTRYGSCCCCCCYCFCRWLHACLLTKRSVRGHEAEAQQPRS
ncbi:unnamed protein product, partial [Closterium sp. NIES-53]